MEEESNGIERVKHRESELARDAVSGQRES